MSDVAEQSRVTILLADYAAVDPVQKVNILGAGFAIAPIDVNTGSTLPMTVVTMVDSPPNLYHEDFSLTLSLVRADGALVQIPMPPTGTPAPLRVAQVIRIQEALHPNIPNRVLWSHTQVLMNFPMGLPLPAGEHYAWQVDIDGTADPRWAAHFYVPGGPNPLVVG